MAVDVAIIGYGPVGALAALCLADAGLEVLILEKSTEPVELPRAVGLDGQTLRAFQRLGLAKEIEALCQPPREPNQIAFVNSRREPLLGLDLPPFGPNGWTEVLFFDQPELEEELRRIIASRPHIEVRLGHEVTALDQDADGVTIHSQAAGGAHEHRASFAIGCDGASSSVRELLGIGWESLDYDQDWLVVDITQGPRADLPLMTMQVCDPDRLTSYICVKDPNRRWEFQLREGETREQMLEPASIRALIASWTAEENYEIRRAAVYQFHAAVASEWRKRRLFLAGDAAHQTPPFLGQGLNAGFRDAVNLGWKIPLVLGKQCDDALLETYAAERDDHARDLVERAVGIGKLMETLAAREAGLPDPHPPMDLGLRPGGTFVPPIRGGVLVEEQCREGTSVGELLRQPIVRSRGGAEVRLDDVLGPGFSVVGRTRRDLEMGPTAQAVFERLGGRGVPLDELEVVAGDLDLLFDAHPAAVVRPDRYVFGVVDDSWSLDRLLLEVGRSLSLVGLEAA